ncbi:class I SAM-dependent methyltransferase [Spirosoma rigui]|uniref:class I SAM-dependent methyltransferase n=1 Tax=Spirosoma rigui TaxID=564064 RepID=UPI0009B05E1C|nr:methyltransferase domain-containing protein [Spirosoma rigui]
MIPILGKQLFGQSSDAIYKMALQAFTDTGLTKVTVADVGAGQGNFARLLASSERAVTLLDDFEPVDLPLNCQWIKADLNNSWHGVQTQFDFVIALEVIEHLENPRHFFREIIKLMKPGAYGFVSTPNNDSLFSRLNFLLTGQHRWFQDSCYPAHITPILEVDLLRILRENGLITVGLYYSNEETIPKLNYTLNWKGKLYSKNFGVLFRKPVFTDSQH